MLTREAGFYLLLVAVGAGLRLWALGGTPLSAREAELAFGAWRLSEGFEVESGVASPLLLYAQAMVFLVLGSGDALARLLPAMVGSLVVLLPYFARRELGRLPALWATGLLALSPTLIHASRRLDGQILVAAAGLVLWIGLRRWSQVRDRGALWLVAGSLAVGLAAGREMYLLLFLFSAFAGMEPVRGMLTEGAGREMSRLRRRLPKREVGLGALAFGTGLFVALATGFLSRPRGIQDAWDLVPMLGAPAVSELLPNPIGLLLWYEPVTLAAGVAAAIMLRDRGLIRFAAFWAAGMLLLQGPVGAGFAALPLMVVPLAILAGGLLGRRTEDLGVIFSSVPQGARGPAIATLGVLLIGSILALRAGGRLNYGAPSASEPLLRTVTSTDVRNLSADVRTASLQRTAEPDRIGVGLTISDPTLLWYLRGFPLTQVGEGFPAGPLPDAVVSEETLAAEGYLGQRYRLEENWRAPGPWTTRQLLAWYLLGEPPAAPDPRDIILWIRNPETS